ncbi:MAG TPA: SDR family NAD(P)-dependent oxidoreductase [Acidimicrobiia bacterium]|nr:SDR family NAD(P)-dependent oxidoreductase [Acidimicrobiia bacterium]
MQAEGVAVVTGASRGIGRAVALELAARGFEVVATMRDPRAGASLPDEARGTLRVARLDVTAPGAFAMPDGLRVLVNNAAVERPHLPFEETPLEYWRDMFETNVFGLAETTRLAIPALRASGGGVVCNVTSSSILAPVPFYAVYRASKAAVSAIGETLRAELAPFGIRIVEIMPGPIDTDMLANSAHEMLAVNYEPYRPMAERMVQGRAAAGEHTTPTADAARAIADAILDDEAPLRHGCDPMGSGLLDAWRHASDEQMMRTMLAGMLG